VGGKAAQAQITPQPDKNAPQAKGQAKCSNLPAPKIPYSAIASLLLKVDF
jgi:hypothetical protein